MEERYANLNGQCRQKETGIDIQLAQKHLSALLPTEAQTVCMMSPARMAIMTL